MESIETKHTIKIAEPQEEYRTVHATPNLVKVGNNPVMALTIAFKLNEEELKQLNETGILYYTQVTGNNPMRPMIFNTVNPLPEELQ